MVEVSICDIFNVSIAILINFLFHLFSSFFFFLLFPSSHCQTVFVSFNLILFFFVCLFIYLFIYLIYFFYKKKNPKMKEK